MMQINKLTIEQFSRQDTTPQGLHFGEKDEKQSATIIFSLATTLKETISDTTTDNIKQ